MKVARKLGYVGKSKERDRRPTLPELYLLMEHFGRVRHKRSDSIPMRKLCGFAIFATRRQEEIVKIRWTDLDADAPRNLAKQRK